MELIKFNMEARAVVKVNAQTGATTTRVLRAGEYREAYKAQFPTASNKEIKREYAAYYKNAVSVSTANLAGELTTGKWGVEMLRLNKAGDKVNLTLVNKGKLGKGVDKGDIEEALANMSVEDLQGLLEKMMAMVPPTGAPSAPAENPASELQPA